MSMWTMTKATSPTPPPIRQTRRQVRNRRGASRSSNVVIEFPDYETAVACYRSPEYQANIKIRQPNATADLIIVEGYEGPQP
jgi:uncharacterized protein (DUF1330 family)